MSHAAGKLQIFFRAGMWIIATLVAEIVFGAIPVVDPPGPSFDSAWVAFVVLLTGAYRLANSFRRPSSAFVYGTWGSLCFVPRGLELMSHAAHYNQAPSDAELVAGWTAFLLFTGSMCWLMIQIHRGVAGDALRTRKPPMT